MELIWGAVGIALAAVGLVELARVGLFWLLRQGYSSSGFWQGEKIQVWEQKTSIHRG